MCDNKGDIETVGLLVDSVVFVSQFGLVGLDANGKNNDGHQNEVKGVYSCLGCSVADVLPMLGHDPAVTNNYVLNENYIPYEEDLVKEFNQLGPRAPGVCLVKQGDQLMGVLVDEQNNARVLGVVSNVIPQINHLEQKENVLLLSKDGHVQLTDSKTVDLDDLAETDAAVGLVSNDGFLLVQPDRNSNELTLILQHGYLVAQDWQVVWIRQAVDQIMAKSKSDVNEAIRYKESQVRGNEIFVVNRGAIVQSNDGNKDQGRQLNLFGSHAAIVNYQAFKRCLSCFDSSKKNTRWSSEQ